MQQPLNYRYSLATWSGCGTYAAVFTAAVSMSLYRAIYIFIFIHHNGSTVQYKNTLTNKLN